MWRDPSGLFPSVDVDRSGALFSSSRTAPMGVAPTAGLCECGCGGHAPIARSSNRSRNSVKGKPLRFINGHSRRRPHRWIVEDRGYLTPCWVWQERVDEDGYGCFKRNKRQIRAHRFYYEELRGPIPEGLGLDHLCRVRGCVNPDHLEPVPQRVNIRRGDRTKLAPQEVLRIRNASGSISEIARECGISRRQVRRIRKGENWGDLQPVPGIPLSGATADVAPPASATSSTCVWLSGCAREATDRLTGFCESHAEFWRDEVREYTDSIGRGELA